MKIFAVVLDYCGGDRTDDLVTALRAWNPSVPLNVLDNGSPHSVCRSTTHRNAENAFIGGGIRDCLRLARSEQADALMFFTNDVEFVTPIDISRFVEIMEADERVVHVSAAITPDSAQAHAFPWMVGCGHGQSRRVWHADILVSLLRLKFIASFGGFPKSRSGWGYAGEMAFHALLQSQQIVVTDAAIVRHTYRGAERPGHPAWRLKRQEMIDVYGARYGGIPWASLRAGCTAPYRRSAAIDRAPQRAGPTVTDGTVPEPLRPDQPVDGGLRVNATRSLPCLYL